MTDRYMKVFLVTVGLALSCPVALLAQASPVLSACSLVPREEVKQYVPWIDLLDQMPLEEAAIGASGSSCNYPSVFIQVYPAPSTLPEEITGPEYEAVSGVGDEAYFRNNRGYYAELYVRAGAYVVTLQASIGDSVEAARPGVISLGTALVAALP